MLHLLAALACLAPSGVEGLSPQELPPDQEAVNKAITRGSGWLIGQAMSPSDVAIHAGKNLTYDGLVLYTLIHAGWSKDDVRYKVLVRRLSQSGIDKTYSAACAAMGLQADDPRAHKQKIVDCAQYLVEAQCGNGQWDYGDPRDIKRIVVPPDSGGTSSRVRVTRLPRTANAPAAPSGDNSNAQYAALGLYSCWRAGVDVPRETIDKALGWWESTQGGDGSWTYADKGKSDPRGFGSMTAGGASSIMLLKRILGHSPKTGSAQRAINWLGENFSVSEHPRCQPDRVRFHYYYLYALERTGDLFPTENMGKHAWYAEGANWLLKNQRGGGSWLGTQSQMEVADTCFAILFLDRVMRVATPQLKPKAPEPPPPPQPPGSPPSNP